VSTVKQSVKPPGAFSVHPFGPAASPAACRPDGQVAIQPSGQVAAAAPDASDAALERQIVTRNMWLRRAVLSLTFFGVGVTAGQVIGAILPRRKPAPGEE